MIARWAAWIVRRPGFAVAAALLAVLGGEFARRNIAHDAMADLSDPQVVLVAEWMGHSATQVATEVTKVLVDALEDTAGAVAVRGSSMSGMAEVEVVLRDESDLRMGRADLLTRLDRARARLPRGVKVRVGPEASSTGWVFQYALADPTRRHDPLELRRLQDEILRPALEHVDGVAEVASLGGAVEQLVVEADPERLRAAGLAFSDLAEALEAASARSDGEGPRPVPVRLGIEQIQALVVTGPAAGGSPVRVADVARVRVANDMPGGLADYNGVPAVGGIVVARRGADVSSVAAGVAAALDRERDHLRPGLELVTVYNRAGLAQRVERTFTGALAEEIVAVVLVIIAFLLHGRSAAVPMITLPLVVLLTFVAMWIFRVPATVMSLGGIGIALGMAVDADVVALEACHRSLEAAGGRCTGAERPERLTTAAASFTPAIVVSLVIAALAFLPVFAFSGENGRLLRPLALTKTFVIAAAALVALVIAPVLRQWLVRGRIVAEFNNPITRGLVRAYRPFVHFALSHPALTLSTAALALASCIPLWFGLGGEFLPRIDEGDQLFMPTTVAGVSPEDAAMQLARFDRALVGHEEVATVFGKVGRADTATDPAPFSMAEVTIQLHRRAEWPEPMTPAELVATLDRDTRAPGWTGAWTAPARARIDMLSTRVRTQVGVRIVARDTARLDDLGARVRSIVMRVPGTRSAVHESLGGETRLVFVADPSALARHGVDPGLVSSTAELVLAGGRIADVERGGRIAALRVVSGASSRPAEQLDEITVRAGQGEASHPVPLELLGHPAFVQTPSVVRSEAGKLASYVHVDLDPSADVLGYVEHAQDAVREAQAAGSLQLGPGERIDWVGQYELLSAGMRRLKLIAPIVAVLMMLLLYLQFRTVVEALIVFASVPFALVGSVWTLYLLRYSLSAPVWVGLLSVVGLAMQTGVVMIVYIDDAFYRRLRTGRIRKREDIVAAHTEGTVRRLRPKVMTVTTMAAGLLPLLWADGAGAEIMRRVAAPMIGGLATSAFLTLEVLPVLYTLWRSSQLRRADRTGATLESVVAVPRWVRAHPPDGECR